MRHFRVRYLEVLSSISFRICSSFAAQNTEPFAIFVMPSGEHDFADIWRGVPDLLVETQKVECSPSLQQDNMFSISREYRDA